MLAKNWNPFSWRWDSWDRYRISALKPKNQVRISGHMEYLVFGVHTNSNPMQWLLNRARQTEKRGWMLWMLCAPRITWISGSDIPGADVYCVHKTLRGDICKRDRLLWVRQKKNIRECNNVRDAKTNGNFQFTKNNWTEHQNKWTISLGHYNHFWW